MNKNNSDWEEFKETVNKILTEQGEQQRKLNERELPTICFQTPEFWLSQGLDVKNPKHLQLLKEVEEEKFNSLYGEHYQGLGKTARYKFYKTGKKGKKSTNISMDLVRDLMTDVNSNALIVRKFNNTNEGSTFIMIQKAFDRLREEFGYEWTHYWKIQKSPLKIVNIITKQEIRFLALEDPSKFQSIAPRFGFFKYIWVEEILEVKRKRKGQADKDIDVMDGLRILEPSALRGLELGEGQIIFTFNSFRSDHPLIEKYIKPYLTEHKTPEEREEKVWQEYYNEKAFGGMGLYIFFGSYEVNEFLTETDMKYINNLKETWRAKYNTEYLGLDGTLDGSAFGLAHKQLKVKEKLEEGTIAHYGGFDWGGSDPTSWGYKQVRLDMTQPTNKLQVTQSEELIVNEVYYDPKKDKPKTDTELLRECIAFYTANMKEYNLTDLTVYVDNREGNVISNLNEFVPDFYAGKLVFAKCTKHNSNGHIERVARRRRRSNAGLLSVAPHLAENWRRTLENTEFLDGKIISTEKHRLDWSDYADTVICGYFVS